MNNCCVESVRSSISRRYKVSRGIGRKMWREVYIFISRVGDLERLGGTLVLACAFLHCERCLA